MTTPLSTLRRGILSPRSLEKHCGKVARSIDKSQKAYISASPFAAILTWIISLISPSVFSSVKKKKKKRIMFIYSAVEGELNGLVKWVECSEKCWANGQHTINARDY